MEELKIDEENIKKETSHVISPNESIETNIKDTSNEILDEEWMKWKKNLNPLKKSNGL